MTRDYNNLAGGLFRKIGLRQFVKFSIVGVGNTLIDFSIYLILSRLFGVFFLWANIISVGLAMLFSFGFNKFWTFGRYDSKLSPELLKFLSVNILYYILNNALLFIFVTVALLPDIISKVIVVIIGLFWNFFANKYWTFATNQQD